jgi:cephalosporin-C deacetylase-like acetyl esterase
MTSARLMIDFAETKKQIDTRKIATYGMSLGGILSSVFISIEPRVDAAVLIVAGGNLAEIMAKSDQGIVEKFRKARMKAENLSSVEELENKMKETFLFDPLIFAPRRSPEDIYMVIAEDDISVTKTIGALEKFWKTPGIKSSGKHFPVILKIIST